MTDQSLRPLGLGEIIDTAFKIYTRHWRTLMLLVAAVVVPAGIVSSLIMNNAIPPNLVEELEQLDPLNPVIDEELLRSMLKFMGAAALAAAIQTAAAFLAAAGSVRAVAEIYLGASPDWRASLAGAIRRLPAIVLTGALILIGIGALSGGVWLFVAIAGTASAGTGAIAALLVIAWFLAVLWLAVAWTPAIPVLIVEAASPPQALTRSFNLVRGRWWPTFGTLLTTWLIVVVLSAIGSRIFEAFLPNGAGAITGGLVSAVIAVATTPFAVAVLSVLYFDLRTRREPFDLARLAADIGAQSTTPQPDNENQLPPTPDRADWPPLPPAIGEGEPNPEE